MALQRAAESGYIVLGPLRDVFVMGVPGAASREARCGLLKLLEAITPMPRPICENMVQLGHSEGTGQLRIFFDTEFTDLDPGALLISIGLVSEDGRTFYAELCDTWRLDDTSDFTKAEVLPLLEGGDCLMTQYDLSKRLAAWLTTFAQPVQLATDSLAWDWPWIQRLFSAPGAWPANLERTPLLLTMNYLNDFDNFGPAVNAAFESGGLRRHHALDDAMANRLGWIAAGGDIDRSVPPGRK